MRKNAMLDKDGFLSVFRNGQWKPQQCHANAGKGCGNWCPLFREVHGELLGRSTVTRNGKEVEEVLRSKLAYWLACEGGERRSYLWANVESAYDGKEIGVLGERIE